MRKVLAFVLFVPPFAWSAPPSILDAWASTVSPTQAITYTAGTDRAMVLCAMQEDGAPDSDDMAPEGVSWGGNAMTRLPDFAEAMQTSGNGIACFYVVEANFPASGSAIAVTDAAGCSGACPPNRFIAGYAVYQNVDQTTPVADSDAAEELTAATTVAGTLVDSGADSVAFSCAYSDATNAWTWNNAWTEQLDLGAGGRGTCGTKATAYTAPSATIGGSIDGTDLMVSVVLQAAASTSSAVTRRRMMQ